MLDGLCLASVEAVEANFSCMCDDVFLKKAKREAKGKIKVISPLELAEEMERWTSE